jgi:hypothetical protein
LPDQPHLIHASIAVDPVFDPADSVSAVFAQGTQDRKIRLKLSQQLFIGGIAHAPGTSETGSSV